MTNEIRTYTDGTTATGPAPLPAQSPAQQETETGPCDKCQGSGKLFDRRIGDVVCDECHGHGWFNAGVAGPAENAPHEGACAVNRGGKCTCSVLDGARASGGSSVVRASPIVRALALLDEATRLRDVGDIGARHLERQAGDLLRYALAVDLLDGAKHG